MANLMIKLSEKRTELIMPRVPTGKLNSSGVENCPWVGWWWWCKCNNDICVLMAAHWSNGTAQAVSSIGGIARPDSLTTLKGDSQR